MGNIQTNHEQILYDNEGCFQELNNILEKYDQPLIKRYFSVYEGFQNYDSNRDICKCLTKYYNNKTLFNEIVLLANKFKCDFQYIKQSKNWRTILCLISIVLENPNLTINIGQYNKGIYYEEECSVKFCLLEVDIKLIKKFFEMDFEFTESFQHKSNTYMINYACGYDDEKFRLILDRTPQSILDKTRNHLLDFLLSNPKKSLQKFWDLMSKDKKLNFLGDIKPRISLMTYSDKDNIEYFSKKIFNSYKYNACTQSIAFYLILDVCIYPHPIFQNVLINLMDNGFCFDLIFRENIIHDIIHHCDDKTLKYFIDRYIYYDDIMLHKCPLRMRVQERIEFLKSINNNTLKGIIVRSIRIQQIKIPNKYKNIFSLMMKRNLEIVAKKNKKEKLSIFESEQEKIKKN